LPWFGIPSPAPSGYDEFMRRPQFRIRWLLALTAVVALVCGANRWFDFFAPWRRPARPAIVRRWGPPRVVLPENLVEIQVILPPTVEPPPKLLREIEGGDYPPS
jgi:hypothetical protein